MSSRCCVGGRLEGAFLEAAPQCWGYIVHGDKSCAWIPREGSIAVLNCNKSIGYNEER